MRTCQRCPACKFTDADGIWPVPGEGPSDAEVALIFEQPGKQENSMHRPMVGKTGDELNSTYLPIAGLCRSEVYIDNAVRCKHADAGEAPPDEVIRVCSEFHLKAALERINPKYVVLCGAVSNSIIGLDLDIKHGSWRTTSLLGWTGRVFSTYHPAIGLHISSKMQNLLDDFKRLRYFLRDELPECEDEYPNPSTFLVSRESQIDDSLEGLYDETHMGVDTESRKTWKGYVSTIKYIPWSIQYAVGPYEAYIIKVKDTKLVQRFGYHARKFRRIVMHNAPHDMDILERVGVEVDWDRVEDTMSMAYIDGRIPKGLKALSYQLCYSTMRNFDDMVRPYGIKAAMEYYEQASMIDWATPDQEPTGEMETKKCPKCKGAGVIGEGRGKKRSYRECDGQCDGGYITAPKMTRKQGMGPKIKRLITDYVNSPGTLDPWKRWIGWESAVDELIEKLGPLPLASVELVPEREILAYAGTDPCSTWRDYPIMKQRHVQLRRSYRG